MLVASWEIDKIDPQKKKDYWFMQKLNLSAKIIIAKDNFRKISFTYNTYNKWTFCINATYQSLSLGKNYLIEALITP